MKLSHFPHECFDIASQNFIHRCILAEYRALFIFKVKGLITRSPGHKTDRSNGCRGVKSISIISQYMQSYWFSKQSKINIIYNISVIAITITMSIILANFGKYAISDCPFICLSVCLLTTLRKNCWTDFHESFRVGGTWYKEQLGTFSGCSI